MPMCEYDRNLIKEVKDILSEIRDEMKKCNQINDYAIQMNMRKSNSQARIHQEALKYQLELMEEANEGE